MNLCIESLKNEVNSFTDRIEGLGQRALTPGESEGARSRVEKFLVRREPFKGEEELKPCMNRLKKVCLEKSLGDRSALINRFIRPILTLRDPTGPLAHAMGFLSSRDLHSTSVVSKDFQKASDLQKLSRIKEGVPVKDLGLTESSLLCLLRRNPGVNITHLNIDMLVITDIVSLLNLCPNLEVLSARSCRISPLAVRN